MSTPLDWLAGGGEMGKVIRAIDWSTTPLGPVESWPQSLRTTVSLCLSSTFPILIAWGPERVQIYNDSYRPICGELHPQSMGQRFNECWASALPAVGHVVDRAQGGEGSYIENLRMMLDRYGYLEEAWMTFSFSPIRDESGGVGGLFHPITEVTDKMLSERRTQGLRKLALELAQAKSLVDIGRRIESFRDLELDAPFLLLYRAGEDAAHLLGRSGLQPDAAAAPATIARSDASSWPLGGEGALVDDVIVRFGELACAPYPESPRAAWVLPLRPPGAEVAAWLVAGVSARRALDPSYRAFYDTLAATVTTAVANVLAYEQEQKRAAALAEIDSAKSAFFSNVSHEFRTPLTLMLGPLEDALASELAAPERERLELVHRNGMRLLKLVNSLLDFSRLEAGRVQTAFVPTDLGALTTDLASAFRSLVERAGLRLDVICEPLAEPVWVDHELFEKILLNLLSNAYKHTFEGGIGVRLTAAEGAVELSVTDTGTGIAAEQLPSVFERFHRIEGARGRSHEGSGIGLALVQELVKLHGGSIRATSQLELGSTFTVSLPTGSAHLPLERRPAELGVTPAEHRVQATLHEATAWGESALAAADVPAHTETRARVLLADDNADMRAYVQRLLGGRYSVEAVADGHAALAAARRTSPDLIVSDVMMPGLDGFGLLRDLKAEPATAAVPVILLSARAGEEATLEGLAAGAADYLVKPFSARELLARVEGAIQIARARTRLEHALEALQRSVRLSEIFMGVLSHDLRNPLHAIGMAATVLSKSSTAEAVPRPVRIIQTSVSRMQRMIDQLLDFTHTRLGRGLPITATPLDLVTLAHSIVDELESGKPGTIELVSSGDTRGEWDRDRLAQLLSNLIANACQHGHPSEPVRVRVRGEGESVALEISNRGAIAAATLATLFEPFGETLTPARGNDGSSGLGLGLYIAQQIALAHGGSIAVTSTEAEGTRFVVLLPRRPPAQTDAFAQPPVSRY